MTVQKAPYKHREKIENYIIRQLAPIDWKAFQQLRLEALSLDGRKFGSTFEDEKAYPDQFWQNWLASTDRAVIGLFIDNEMVALVSVFCWTPQILSVQAAEEWELERPGQTAIAAAGYMRRQYRGQGLAEEVNLAGINWAAQQPQFSRLLIPYRSSNRVLAALCRSQGLLILEEHPHHWADGGQDSVTITMMELDPWRQANGIKFMEDSHAT